MPRCAARACWRSWPAGASQSTVAGREPWWTSILPRRRNAGDLAYRGYKQPRNTQALRALMDDLQAATPLARPGTSPGTVPELARRHRRGLRRAYRRAAAQGHATKPDDTQKAAARSQGWITLPTSPLTELA